MYKIPKYLFEISWEVCNMVGGIYTVLSTKMDEMKRLFGDNYISIGPDLVKESHETLYFVEDNSLFPEWRERAISQGLKIRIGRWKLPSKPLAVLIDFTTLYQSKNEILGHLWEQYKLDSIQGQWDYIEPVLFGYASGQVIESFVDWNIPNEEDIVAQFHEWMTGAGVLYLKEHAPEVATVFTTHATYLGRAISGNGLPLYNELSSYNPTVMASRFNIVSQQSMEQKAVENADVFTTVSNITAMECKQFLNREPDVITENGISDAFILDDATRVSKRQLAREKVFHIADVITGVTVSRDSMLLINSGRYEFKNKGIDLYIRALSELNNDSELARDILAVIAVPANIAGPSKQLTRRLNGTEPIEGHTEHPLTHHVFDIENDAIVNALRENGLNNNPEDRVKVIFIPSYLNGDDGVFNINYNDFLYAFDLSVFPSYYEPWGYTPLESIAHGLPTVTTDLSGFGRFMKDKDVNSEAVTVIHREEGNGDYVVSAIAEVVENLSKRSEKQWETITSEALRLASMFYWKDLIVNYLRAYDMALNKLKGREYMRQSRLYSEVLRNFDFKKQDTPNWKKFMVEINYSDEMQKLNEMAHNLWWSWNIDAIDLFQSLDPEAWQKHEQNPLAVMENFTKYQIDSLENNSEFVSRLNIVYQRFKDYMSAKPDNDDIIAYFSMEYGLQKSLKIYSGGLGILAGDYLKQASDSNVNMVGIGLLYRYGYFNQSMSVSGEQLSEYVPQKFSQLPLDPVRDTNGDWVTVSIAFPGRSVYAKAWRVNVGRVGLYLLDTDIEENSHEDRIITGQLYGGDNEMRIKQELFLGIGGIRLLEKLGVKPTLFHCNEGHAAFCGLERLNIMVAKHNLEFDVAMELVRSSTLFTTHTPVSAGHDAFEEHLMRTYMSYYPSHVNISWDKFMGLGRFRPNDPNEKFSMSVLATTLSDEVYGVSRIHGRVSREMFQQLWPGYYAEENHIGYVTNGVHLPTWADAKWQRLFSKVMGEDYLDNQSDFTVWEKMQDVPASEIWDIRKELKHNLMEFIKVKLAEDMRKRQESPSLIIKTIDSLDENALIIGFARRFATYKRAHLLFTNLERLAEIVNNPKRPVIFVFAGKAHPNDKAGQDLIKNIIEVSRKKEFIGKILFISNYDIEIGKMLTSSVDIWLNTPTRPLEASGTSGEKAAMNGVLNFSVLDGWWAEGYRPDAGWAIKEERTYQDQRYQDELDAETIYNMLEDEITPLYFTRNADGVPETWVQYIKNNFMEIAPFYTMKRMLDDYFSQYYDKLIKRTKFMRADRYSKAFELTAWRKKIESHWDTIEVSSIKVPDPNIRALNLGDVFIAEITLKIPGLDKNDIGIELMFAEKENDVITKILRVEQMTMVDYGDEWVRFYISLPVFKAGVYNYTFRIYPTNKMLAHRQDLPLVKWI